MENGKPGGYGEVLTPNIREACLIRGHLRSTKVLCVHVWLNLHSGGGKDVPGTREKLVGRLEKSWSVTDWQKLL